MPQTGESTNHLLLHYILHEKTNAEIIFLHQASIIHTYIRQHTPKSINQKLNACKINTLIHSN